MATTTLEQLVAAWHSGTLALPALFDALHARGAIAPEHQRAELAWLDQQAGSGALDAELAQALAARLRSVQAAEVDGTRVQVGGPSAAGAATGGDAAAARATGTPVPAVDATGSVLPTGTGSGGSINSTGWRQLAAAEGSERAVVGMLLKGRFLLERELGHGGMGVVFLAKDERKVEARDRDPYVAVKVLNDEFRRHPDSLIALQRESRRSQKLAHDNIVRVYDFDKAGTIVYMTMEYIDGGSLKTLIHEEAFDGMPLAKARPLIEGMARALERAHSQGVVHSDFKPGNVMVTKDGVAKVFDFGIARAGKFDNQAGEQTVFDAGTLGALTPAYASLEMLRGADPKPSDDIYAFGCVLYELLTGKHPFDKVSAEVALQEGRKPPRVRGLSKRQNQALANAVAFHAAQRTQRVADVVEGLRDIGIGERARPYLIGSAVAAVVLAAGAFGVLHYLGVRHVNEVVARFASTDPQHYPNEDVAYQALAGLGDDESRVVSQHNDLIGTYLLGRLAAYWDPSRQRYDYGAVQHVFAIRDRLKLYSPALDVRRGAIEQERNGSLNRLDTQLGERTTAGALFPGQRDNVVETLTAIRAIDPKSALLDNPELQLKYDLAIGQSLDAGKLDEARQRLAVATRLFPDSARLKQRAAQLATLAQANSTQLAAARQSVPQASADLEMRLAAPALTAEWYAAVAGDVHVLQGDATPATRALLQKVPGVVAAQAATATTPAQVQQAAALVALTLTLSPSAAPLLAQRDRLAALQQQQQAALAAEGADAEVASRIQSLKSAAVALDVAKATESLAQIRTLQPDNPFLKTDGPRLVAEAYVGQAGSLAAQGRFRAAADTVREGIAAIGDGNGLAAAGTRMDFVADLMAAARQPVTASGIRQLRGRLANLDKHDSQALAALEADLKVHGVLPGGSFAAVLASLRPAAAARDETAAAERATASRRAPIEPYVYGETRVPYGQPAATPLGRPAAPRRSQPPPACNPYASGGQAYGRVAEPQPGYRYPQGASTPAGCPPGARVPSAYGGG